MKAGDAHTLFLDRFSVFLLAQIKPPSSNHEPRFNVDAVLDIIFFCYDQSNERHQDLGRRLMGLVSHLVPYKTTC
jgi:hypothetical protein